MFNINFRGCLNNRQLSLTSFLIIITISDIIFPASEIDIEIILMSYALH